MQTTRAGSVPRILSPEWIAENGLEAWAAKYKPRPYHPGDDYICAGCGRINGGCEQCRRSIEEMRAGEQLELEL